MKGKVLVIGTMNVDDEELNGAFVETDKSELDSRFFGEDVVIKKKSELEGMIEALKDAYEFIGRLPASDQNSYDKSGTEVFENIKQALKKAGIKFETEKAIQ